LTLKNKYAKGANAERRLVADLKKMYPLVIRSPGSKGPFDVVAVSTLGVVALYQVKCGRKPSVKKWKRDIDHWFRKNDLTAVVWLVWYAPYARVMKSLACVNHVSKLTLISGQRKKRKRP